MGEVDVDRYFDIHEQPAGRKRRVVGKNSCNNCKASKTGCDPGRPCSRCLRLGLDCQNVVAHRRGRPAKSLSELSFVQQHQSEYSGVVVSSDRASLPSPLSHLFPSAVSNIAVELSQMLQELTIWHDERYGSYPSDGDLVVSDNFLSLCYLVQAALDMSYLGEQVFSRVVFVSHVTAYEFSKTLPLEHSPSLFKLYCPHIGATQEILGMPRAAFNALPMAACCLNFVSLPVDATACAVFVYTNPEAAQLLGTTETQLRQDLERRKFNWWLDHVAVADWKGLARAFLWASVDRAQKLTMRCRLSRYDGSMIWVECQIAFSSAADGPTNYILFTWTPAAGFVSDGDEVARSKRKSDGCKPM